MPNAIPLGRPWDQAQAGVARLRQLIDMAQRGPQMPMPAQMAIHTPPMSGQSNGGSSSVADELKKLADLRAAGVLTNAEFASLKARVLSRPER